MVGLADFLLAESFGVLSQKPHSEVDTSEIPKG